ncbi:MAG: hypothetical protein ACI9J3_002884 [Parvicellaceae bacterium]|jgi:hypothetical protein
MAESKPHKDTSNRIAKKNNADYNSKKGVDIVTNSRAIEVETENTVKSGIKQLQGHKKPSYIAGTNQKAVDKALELTKGTTIGVMDKDGNIVKSSTRKKS